MTTFTRYFDNSINEWIETREIHDRVVEIRGMDVNQVAACSENLQTECRINPSYEHTYEFRVLAKTTMRVIQECRNRGDSRTRRVGPPLTAGRMMMAAFQGIVIGEVATDLWAKFKQK